jgi:hypothetical protein
MSEANEIRAVAARLNELADALRGDDVSDERAEELAREAADLVARAGNEIERAMRESASGEG